MARWVSILAHPFAMIGVLVPVSSARFESSGGAWRVTAWTIGFVVVPVSILIIRQRRRGVWDDVDASRKTDRPILFAVGAVGLLTLLTYLQFSGTHTHLLRGVLVALAMLMCCAAITPWIKVSLHLAGATLTATCLIAVGSPVGWIIAALLPLLAWSRFALARHSPVEILAGAVIGTIAGIVI